MNLRQVVQTGLHRWKIIVTLTILGLICGSLLGTLSTKQYSSELTLYVSTQGSDNTTTAYQGGLLSEQRTKSYVQLISSDRVGQTVSDRLKLGIPGPEVASKVSAVAQPDSVVLTVTVTDTVSQRATDIANGVGQAFAELVAELEQPLDRSAPPAVAARVVQPATYSSTPVSPNLPLDIGIGLVLGFSLGVAASYITETLSDRIREPEEFSSIVDRPYLGSIVTNDAIGEKPIAVTDNTRSQTAESFRQLRAALLFVDIDRPRKILAVTSAVPSEGKSVTAINIAAALGQAGSRVLLIEGDLRRPMASEYLSLDSSVGLTTILSGRATAEGSIQRWRGMIDVLTSGSVPPNPSELLGSRRFADVLNSLSARYDFVIIDSAPVLPVADTLALAPFVDGMLFVARFGRSRRTEVRNAMKRLGNVDATIYGCSMTVVPSKSSGYYGEYYQAAGQNGRSSGIPSTASIGEGIPSSSLRSSNPVHRR